LRVNLTLRPGAQTQTVTVTGAVPIINRVNEVLSSTVESSQLSQLPINGNLYTKVLDFQPGVHGNPGGNSPNYAVNGAGGMGDYYLIDGVENTNMFVNSGPLIGADTSTDELTILPQDAVGEVNVMTNPPAEYGWFHGGVVNVGVKSGTNTLHGSAYGFFRNNDFDAFDPYLKGTGVAKQTDDFKQFGGSFGGPIKKGKLFYFGAFDGSRYNVGSGVFAVVPTVSSSASVDVPASSVPLAIEDMINNHGVLPSQLSLNLSDCTVTGSAPSAVATCGTKGVFRNNSNTTANLGVPGQNFGHSNNVIGKIDYRLNDKNLLNGEYFFGQAVTETPNPGVPAFWNNTNRNRKQMMRAVWIATPSANWVNDLRFGYNRYNLADGNAECSADGNFSSGNAGQPNYAALGFLAGTTTPYPFCGFPGVNFNGPAGYTSWGAASFPITDQGVFQYTYSANENLSWTHGTHNWKFGFEYHHTRFAGLGIPGVEDGILNFDGGVAFGACGGTGEPACPFGGAFPASTDLQDYLAGALGAANQVLANEQQIVGTTLGVNRYALYVEDNFRVSSRVTADLGVRYELEPAIRVGNNVAGNFDPYSPTGMDQQNGIPLYQTFKTGFSPRAGFAWDITGKGTTVLRVGMGASYDTRGIDDYVSYSFGAGVNAIPTGFNLYNDGGLVFPASGNPQAVKAAAITIPGASLNWACNSSAACGASYSGGNVPVFPASLNTDIACGTGNPAITLADGSVPSPCNVHAWGTVVSTPSGKLSMNTSYDRSPMYTWTLGIEHAFTANISLTVNYVGTHAYKLATERNINQPTPGASGNSRVAKKLTPGGYGAAGTLTGPIQQREPYFSQFPWFGSIFVYGPGGFSNYNSLQASFVARSFHGVTTNVSYTFSRDLATASKGENDPFMFNANCIACTYGLRTPTQDLGLTLVYQLPGVNSFGQLLKGWKLSSAINIQSGDPLTAADTSNDLAGVGATRGLLGGPGEPWNIFGSGRNFNNLGRRLATDCAGPRCGSAMPQECLTAAANEPVNAAMNALDAGSSNGTTSLTTIGYCFISPNRASVIVPPAQGTFGNMRPGTLIGAPFHEWDLSAEDVYRSRAAWRAAEPLGFQRAQ
jgi:hypothetical protein